MQTKMQWVYNGHAMVHRNVNYIPILQTIFDEILMSFELEQELHTEILTNDKIDLDVNIKVDKRYISIHCFGVFFPIENDNFDPWDTLLLRNSSIRKYMDPQGSSIFSRFVITTFNASDRKCKKVFYGKPGKKRNAKITNCSNGCHWTTLSCYCNELQDDMAALMRKRVVDLAALYKRRNNHKLKVHLDGHLLTNNFSSYVDLYLPSPSKKTSKRFKIFIKT
ncbi:hypothetical protein BDA96_10G181900 [Sorghum bicolor]|uniref:DNA topoisomerase (ATP-hydrolyzing) n=1 Tax=Sorghum bicolor TaxID=4558 RepID=A0A921U0P4_SORBI|nr:hypothetical protein BDA96_10G181900 [Sorghum bicolor]